ncbi:threonine/homoserine efflux transporter RhtA [Gemmobacter caeni]|uniref:Threonine/homoserine efflux transporter RhtA n=2 Tax=Gemmobacter TaxID=204456 RepID=A0A2T6AYW2_9RHOB|nr:MULTISPECIES: DMT family transporter [Gemmobacter]PTX48990.1 threonine/homoserine efflux transporter RhtA [Gemmobacter caeni]TWI99009.1 threonine/homoserine efflux transporter RhtA [Gemmobacter caeni]GHC31658.1 ABC transporter permease [Gemmobacter nanjingensis]
MKSDDWARLIALSVLWGGSFFFVEIALTGLPPFSVVWGRVALGALALAVMLRGRLPRGWAVWRALAVMGFLNNVVPFCLFAFAQGEISGALAAILNATTPLWGVVVAHLAGAEPLTARRLGGVAAGIAGVAVMAGGGAGALPAMIACLAAALSYAFAGLWGRRFREMGVPPLQAAFGQVTAATVILLPVWLAVDAPWRLAMPPAQVWAAVAGIGVLSTALAYALYFRLLVTAGAVNLMLVTFLIPVSAAALGALVLGTRLGPQHFAGFALIALGLWAVAKRPA